MAATYRVYNGAQPTTSSFVKVTTGSALKTMLQLAPKTGIDLKVTAWGASFDGSASATGGTVELIETDVAATVTASAAADIIKMNNPGGPAADSALITLSTTTTGYTASAEGTTTASRLGDCQIIAPTNQYVYQSPLGFQFLIQAGKFCRIRVNFGAAISCVCWIEFEG